MRLRQRHHCRRFAAFFRIALSHDDLANHYRGNFIMMQHHKYSLTELNEMLPWEREVYVAMLVEYVKEENDRIKQVNSKYGKM
jgi:hypothetical protein